MKTTKQMAILAVIAFFSGAAAPLPSLATTDTRVEIKKLTKGPHQPPINAPKTGGAPAPCPPGGCQ